MAAVGRSVVDHNVERSDLNCRQRRQVSRGLKRLIAREQNEVKRLLRELRGATKKGTEMAEANDVTKSWFKLSGRETEKTGGGVNDDETWPRGGNERES